MVQGQRSTICASASSAQASSAPRSPAPLSRPATTSRSQDQARPTTSRSTVDVLAPGAVAATTTEEVVRHADIIVLAVPTHRFRELPRDLFAGKILIDAMNYWEPVDGDDPELTAARRRHEHDRARALPFRPRGEEPQPTRLPPTRRERAAQGSTRPHCDRRGRRRPTGGSEGHETPRPARIRPRRRAGR